MSIFDIRMHPIGFDFYNTQTYFNIMLSILYDILSDPARMYGKESKDFPHILYLGIHNDVTLDD
jgi:hypothetical protein